jgi:hypothetical protein
MPDIEAKQVESTRQNRAIRSLDANPLPSFDLMTGSSELP